MHPILTDNGLNLNAVFNIDKLPIALVRRLATLHSEVWNNAQLVLLGHGGPQMWSVVRTEVHAGGINPVDDFVVRTVAAYFLQAHPTRKYRLLYPGDDSDAVPLLELGTLAGWHHPSPFLVGVNSTWGPWFAYRAVVLADTHLDVTPRVASVSPCQACESQPCIAACPPAAIVEHTLELRRCSAYRRGPTSHCAQTCLSRMACPVALEHRYSAEQIAYHYRRSLIAIRSRSE
ncbi:MAG: hypothetical protein V3V08_04030 [Nannocystaceae bacterium]